MDTLSPTARSAVMARIRGKNTQPERVVRSILHRLGFRFRLHVKDLPGCPDIVLPKHRTVVLVHGCFWHRHPRCRFAYTPKSRTAFWSGKFRENVDRDRRARRKLRGLGWRVIILWECHTYDAKALERRLATALRAERPR